SPVCRTTAASPVRQHGANPPGGCGVVPRMTVAVVPCPRTGEDMVLAAGAALEAEVRPGYQAHFGRLPGWAAHLVGDRDTGHDLAAEAVVRLLGHWDEGEEPRAWLYTTCGNLVRDRWRKRGREAAAYERFQGGAAGPDVSADGPDLAQVISVREAVEALPERLRMPVLLYYFADLSVTQVARALNRSEGAVKRYLYDARARLATVLREAR